MERPIEAKPIVAVLTGDIIDSTLLAPDEFEGVRSHLLEAIQEIQGWKDGLVLSKAEFFRGDSWQLLLGDASQALRAALFLRAALIAQGKADTRISIGIGEAGEVSPSRVSLSVGQAFRLSGKGLDSMWYQTSLVIAIGPEPSLLGEWLGVAGNLCDALIRSWTARQAQIVQLALHPSEPVHERIAQALTPAITKQAVAKALAGASWGPIYKAILAFERIHWEDKDL